MCQRKGEEWKAMGVRGGNRDMQHEKADKKMSLKSGVGGTLPAKTV